LQEEEEEEVKEQEVVATMGKGKSDRKAKKRSGASENDVNTKSFRTNHGSSAAKIVKGESKGAKTVLSSALNHEGIRKHTQASPRYTYKNSGLLEPVAGTSVQDSQVRAR
jgi:hypothetical protein